MKFAPALLLTVVSSFASTAMAQEKLEGPDVLKHTATYQKYDGVQLSYSDGGGCTSYGTSCSYSFRVLAPSSLEAAKYVASLPKGVYLCEGYYPTSVESPSKFNGTTTTYFAPAIYCEPVTE